MIDPNAPHPANIEFAKEMPDNVRRLPPAKVEDDPRRGFTSASNAAADDLCPGRHRAQRGLPEATSKDAEMGTRIHAALAQDNRNRINPGALERLTLEEREIFDGCREIEKRLLTQYFAGEMANPHKGDKLWRHQRYRMRVPVRVPKDANEAQTLPHFEHSGEADVIHKRGNRILILDYKCLPGEVAESPSNLQLRDLAVLAAGQLLATEVAVAIVQPLVTWAPELCVYDRAALRRAVEEMFGRVRKSNDPASPKVAGETQCKFCRAKGSCSEYQRWAGAMAVGMSSLLDVPVLAWTPEQRAQFCERRATAQKWLDECEAQMKTLLAADANGVPGWELAPGNERETIVNPQLVFDRFLTAGGKVEGFMPCVNITKGKLKEQVHALTGEKGKALDQTLKDMLSGSVEKKQNAPSLAKKK